MMPWPLFIQIALLMLIATFCLVEVIRATKPPEPPNPWEKARSEEQDS